MTARALPALVRSLWAREQPEPLIDYSDRSTPARRRGRGARTNLVPLPSPVVDADAQGAETWVADLPDSQADVDHGVAGLPMSSGSWPKARGSMNEFYQMSRADLDAAQRIAQHCFGRPAHVERVPSFNNFVCRLRMTDDAGQPRERILKLARGDVRSPALLREPQVMALLRQHGLPAPHVEFEDTAGRLVGRPFFLMASAGQRTTSDLSGLSQPNRRRLFRQVGRLFAKIHSLPFAQPADFDGHRLVAAQFSRTPIEAWHRQQIDYARTHRLFEPAVLDELLAALGDLPEPRNFAMCHGDFNPSQCVRSGAQVTAIVDWEGSYVGDPLFDYAVWDVLLDVAAPGELAQESRKAYTELRPLPDSYERDFRTFKMAHALGLICTFHATRRDGMQRAARATFGRLSRSAVATEAA